MKTARVLLVILIIAAIGGAIGWFKSLRRQQAETAAREYTEHLKAERAVELERLANESQRAVEPPSPVKIPVAENPPVQPDAQRPEASRPVAINPPVTPAQTPRQGGRELQDPLARVALGLVGKDPLAEEYWIGAIFDPSIPDGEREDLMEDLNEEGLIDPRRPTPEDIPLIEIRIALIEQVSWQADSFMLTHLGEAYKDLWNLLDRAQR
jgi:hypothetical protein